MQNKEVKIMGPKDRKQINQYQGKRVEVEFKDGRLATGKLAFYNWEQQVIHLSNYELNIPDKSEEGYSKRTGTFLVINCREWKTVQVIK